MTDEAHIALDVENLEPGPSEPQQSISSNKRKRSRAAAEDDEDDDEEERSAARRHTTLDSLPEGTLLVVGRAALHGPELGSLLLDEASSMFAYSPLAEEQPIHPPPGEEQEEEPEHGRQVVHESADMEELLRERRSLAAAMLQIGNRAGAGAGAGIVDGCVVENSGVNCGGLYGLSQRKRGKVNAVYIGG